ncbi:MAG: diacylglycerol kinase family protein [Alphaproteobacteria bacterium]
MRKIGIISNPGSHHNLRHMVGFREMITSEPDLLYVETDDMVALPEIFADFARRDVGLILINGGDGTAQATMTAVLNHGDASEKPPSLAVLPAGRTNLIAHNIGLAGSPEVGLARLLDRRRAGLPLEEISHPVLSLDLGDGSPITHGMFMGSAAFYRGTMMGRDSFHPVGAAGSVVVGLSLGLAVLRALVGRPGGILQGHPMTLTPGTLTPGGDSEAAREQDYFLILATTLDRLIMGLSPFWNDGDGDGPLRLTTVRYPPPRLASALLPLARGRPRPWMAASGYASRRLGEFTLLSACPIVFDGQIFTPDPAVPVTISGDRRLSFLRC